LVADIGFGDALDRLGAKTGPPEPELGPAEAETKAGPIAACGTPFVDTLPEAGAGEPEGGASPKRMSEEEGTARAALKDIARVEDHTDVLQYHEVPHGEGKRIRRLFRRRTTSREGC
jgi:hypothetical protein